MRRLDIAWLAAVAIAATCLGWPSVADDWASVRWSETTGVRIEQKLDVINDRLAKIEQQLAAITPPNAEPSAAPSASTVPTTSPVSPAAAVQYECSGGVCRPVQTRRGLFGRRR